MAYSGVPNTVQARVLRHQMTKPEVVLWTRLRVFRPLGYHIRRQAPVGPYVADSICHAAKLVIEVDGRQHLEVAAHRRDTARDRWFASQGYETLRLHASDVLQNADDVARQVLDRLTQLLPERAALRANAPPPVAAARLRPPHEGEG